MKDVISFEKVTSQLLKFKLFITLLFLEFALRKQMQNFPAPTGSISPTASWVRPDVSRTSSNRSDRINPELYIQATVSSVANLD